MTASDVYMSFISKDVAETIRLDAEDDAMETANRLAGERARQASIEVAAETEARAASDPFRTAEPPDDLDVDTAGLPPMRARLVRFVAWIGDLEKQHGDLVAGRELYLEQQKVPAMTKATLAKLIADDRSGLLALMTSGGKDISKHTMRSRERAELEKQLAGDLHAAETATACLTHAEAKIDAMAAQIDVLNSRRNDIVADALTEICQMTDGARLIAEGAAIQKTETSILGLTAARHALKGLHYEIRPVSVTLPNPPFPVPGLSGATDDPGLRRVGAPIGQPLVFSLQDQFEQRGRWLDLAKRLSADPRAGDLS